MTLWPAGSCSYPVSAQSCLYLITSLHKVCKCHKTMFETVHVAFWSFYSSVSYILISQFYMCTSAQMVEKYLWTLHGCKPHPPSEEECRVERQRLVRHPTVCIVLQAIFSGGMLTG